MRGHPNLRSCGIRGVSEALTFSIREWKPCRCSRHEEVVVVKIAVHADRDLGCFGPKRRPSALQEDNRHNASISVWHTKRTIEARAACEQSRSCPGSILLKFKRRLRAVP